MSDQVRPDQPIPPVYRALDSTSLDALLSLVQNAAAAAAAGARVAAPLRAWLGLALLIEELKLRRSRGDEQDAQLASADPAKRRVAQHWASYRERVVHPEAGPGQVTESRRAFYAGAQAMFHLMVHGVSRTESDEPTEEDLRLMHDLERELRQFSAAVLRGDA